VTRLGGHKATQLGARVMAATNTDLAARVAQGRFRLDLYHRLSVFQITMPPLRERREDIPVLVERYLEELGSRVARAPATIDDGASELLRSYDFPGNVRELRNILEQATIMAGGEPVGVAHLPERLRELRGCLPVGRPARPDAVLVEFVPGQDSLATLEDRLVNTVLDKAGGKVSRAAQMLGVSRFALSRRLAKRRPS